MNASMQLANLQIEQLRTMAQEAGACATEINDDLVAVWGEDHRGEWEVTFAGGSWQETWDDTFKTEREALVFAIESSEEANS